MGGSSPQYIVDDHKPIWESPLSNHYNGMTENFEQGPPKLMVDHHFPYSNCQFSETVADHEGINPNDTNLPGS